jgi:hypothetical protein
MASYKGDLRPGAVRVTGSSIVLGVGVWAKKESGVIHIRIGGGRYSPTTVTNQPSSDRYHRTLFRNLRRTLKDAGVWPFGGEGSETEEKPRVRSRTKLPIGSNDP